MEQSRQRPYYCDVRLYGKKKTCGYKHFPNHIIDYRILEVYHLDIILSINCTTALTKFLILSNLLDSQHVGTIRINK